MLFRSSDEYKNQKIEDIKTYIKSDNSRQLKIPVVTISNKTGYYIDFIHKIISELNVRNMWRNFDEDTTKEIDERCNNRIIKSFVTNMKKEIFNNPQNNTDHVFFIDGIYNKHGIGLIVAGINRGGVINTGDTVYIGPFGKEFKEVKVKSIHNYLKQKVQSAYDHNRVKIGRAHV